MPTNQMSFGVEDPFKNYLNATFQGPSPGPILIHRPKPEMFTNEIKDNIFEYAVNIFSKYSPVWGCVE